MVQRCDWGTMFWLAALGRWRIYVMNIDRAIAAAKIAGIQVPAGIENPPEGWTFGHSDAPAFHTFYTGIWGMDDLTDTHLLILAFYTVGAGANRQAPNVSTVAEYLLRSAG